MTEIEGMAELDAIAEWLIKIGFPAPRSQPVLSAVQSALAHQHQVIAMMVQTAGGTVALRGPIADDLPLHRYVNKTVEPPTIVFTNGPIGDRERTEECIHCHQQTIARLPVCLTCGLRRDLPKIEPLTPVDPEADRWGD